MNVVIRAGSAFAVSGTLYGVLMLFIYRPAISARGRKLLPATGA